MFETLRNLFRGKAEEPSTEYWLGDIGLTLMVYENNLEAHVQSDIRRYDYFFRVPSTLRASISAADFEKRLNGAIGEVYLQHRLHFQRAEPNDPNYIAVVEAGYRQLSAPEIAAKPWLAAQRPHWEQSNCLALSATGHEKVEPSNF